MAVVYVYLGEATYTGSTEFKWASPEIGARHRLMLFLAQDVGSEQQALATSELSRFGFSQIDLKPGRAILVESLNAQEMRVFQKHYEEALAAGSSVVWYPEHAQRHAI
jgi:hypothetical protein